MVNKQIFYLLGGKKPWSTPEPNGWAETVQIQDQKNLHKLLLFEASDNSDLIRVQAKGNFS